MHPPHPGRFARDALALGFALLAGACQGDGAGDSEPGTTAASDAQTTGATEPAPTTGATEPDPTTVATDPGDASDAGSDDSGDPVEVGPNFGLLTFNYYPADASGSPAQLGMAGAWRTAAFTTDDFFAVRSLSLFFPLAADAPDTLVVHDPGVYEWGKKDTWVALGNGVKLGGEGGDSLACLELVDDSYPVYLSDGAGFFDPACAPDPTRWKAAASYDVVAYGGETYADQIRPAAVITPAALTVTAPAIDVFDFPLAKADDLAITWSADGGAGDRVVIRVWDQFGRQIVVHAADDGSQDIPGAELDKLAAGPATLTIAREHVSELGPEPGTLRVVARHETWAYPDLF